MRRPRSEDHHRREPKFDYITPTVELSGVLALPLAVAAEHSVHYKCLLSLS